MSYELSTSGLVDYPAGSSFGPRTLADHEFVWLLSGTARWHVDGEIFLLRAGSLVLARPGMSDRFEWDRRCVTRHAYVHFSERSERPGPTPGPQMRTLSAGEPLAGLLSYLMWLLADPSPDTSLRARGVLALAVEIFTDGPLPSDVDVELLPELIRAIADIELLRLRRVEELLSRGNLPIAEIAPRCGFADARHLARRFAAFYGLSPSQFRRSGMPAGVASPLAATGLLRLYRDLRRETVSYP
ncbi:MAG: helix-turn-helix domain-containing protein [Nakamurella sp.]